MPVVEGEDTESDEEETQPGREESFGSSASPGPRAGTVVSGEAPETDDEDDEALSPTDVEAMTVETESKSKFSAADIRGRIKELTRRRSSEGASPRRRVKRDPRFETLLHRKLREDFVLLRRDWTNQVGSVFRSLTKDVQQQRSHLRSVHAIVEDAGNNFRGAKEDLRDLEDKLEVAFSGKYLPTLKVDLRSSAGFE